MQPSAFSQRIMGWYRSHRRDLPWRGVSDPYRIWISEVILQQTRVAQGLPYYLRLVHRFPTVQALAAASEEEVLRLWQGLGYYSRARRLRQCAQAVVERHGGRFPDTYAALCALPGVGAYTAAAIASIAFRLPHAAVDGNVYRVLARVFGLEDDISTAAGKACFAEKANALLDPEQPGEYNQAVMEFGALCCTPKIPACAACVFQSHCEAYCRGNPAAFPRKAARRAATRRHIAYFVFQRGQSVALACRTQRDIWQGLYDFYAVESARSASANRLIADSSFLRSVDALALQRVESGVVKHTLTHRVILARFVRMQLPTTVADEAFRAEGLSFYTPAQLATLPKSVLAVRYLIQMGALTL